MSVQERIIVNEAEEEAKKNRGKILGLFPRRDRQVSGTSTPVERKSSDQPTKKTDGVYEYDDDELPPREEADLGSMAPSTHDNELTPEQIEEQMRAKKAAEEAKKAEERALQAIPATAGFDFSAISKELGKDIDMAKLGQPEPQRELNAAKSTPLPHMNIERSGSAPPIHVEPPSEPFLTRSSSYAPNTDDDTGDITFASNQASKLTLNDTSAWGQPQSSAISPSSSPSGRQPSSYGYNAWSTSPTSSTQGMGLMRSAPPARPHPPEFLANPFAADTPSITLSEKGSWSKDEDLATNNPW